MNMSHVIHHIHPGFSSLPSVDLFLRPKPQAGEPVQLSRREAFFRGWARVNFGERWGDLLKFLGFWWVFDGYLIGIYQGISWEFQHQRWQFLSTGDEKRGIQILLDMPWDTLGTIGIYRTIMNHTYYISQPWDASMYLMDLRQIHLRLGTGQ